jgi:uncharacterized SAM-binding protein YcdF (DUF218 family)
LQIRQQITLLRLRYVAKPTGRTASRSLIQAAIRSASVPEAQQMRAVLEQDFQVPVRWTEDASDNTLESAQRSFRILQQAGVRKVYLVTHAWHMPRADRTGQF